MKLYEIDKALADTIEQADPITGEIDILAFEQLQLEKEKKQEGVAKYIMHLQNDNDVLENEIERLKKIKALNEARQEWLKGYLQKSMEIDGAAELDFTTHRVKICKNPPRLVFHDYQLIPEKYTRKKIEYIPDKNAIKKDLMEGIEVKGCRLEQSTRLSIK